MRVTLSLRSLAGTHYHLKKRTRRALTNTTNGSMHNHVRSSGTDLKATAFCSQENAAPTPPHLDDLIKTVRDKRLLRVLQSIEANLPRSVHELAARARLTPTHLQRLFKQETGVHLHALLCERRLSMAASLLTTTDMEVKEVAYLAGYGHHSSFVRAFQRRYGQCPKLYRQNNARHESPQVLELI
jgi:transcriptional regulator GlxA family with amidase domain